jgi:putative copper resistance protein D
MPNLYYLNVTIHVLAAMLWLGGMFFLGAVGAPLLRAIEPPELRQRLFQSIGERFRTVGWIAIAVLLVTGTVNLHYRGMLHWVGVLGSVSFWHTNIGLILGIKLLCVTIMVVVSAVHDFIQGPRAGRAAPGSPEAIRFRSRAAWLARVNAIVGVLLVTAAVRLARGG